jgi:flagellar L-ring protein precursor FlgH
MRVWILALAMVAFAAMAQADSLFTEEVESKGTLVANKLKTFEVGEIITVLVREQLDASTNANTNTKKESEVAATTETADNKFLTSSDGLNIAPGTLPNWGIEAENELKTQGTTQRGNSLTTTIACVVMAVDEHGNVEIEGSKQVRVNREDSRLRVKGTIRARDVTPANTILSTQIANADVHLTGSGPLWNNQRRGIVTKILDWFSPF